MPGDASVTLRRQYSLNSTDYRYGFNGKEGDDEIKGDDNQQDYGMRIYDPRVARFLSVDPIAREYPWYTPYQFAGNMPIWAVDLDGEEPKPAFKEYMDQGKGYAIIVTVDPNYLNQMVNALAANNIFIGWNIVKSPSDGSNLFFVETQFFQGYSINNPNISAQFIGLRRRQQDQLAPIPTIVTTPIEFNRSQPSLKEILVTMPPPIKKEPTTSSETDPAGHPVAGTPPTSFSAPLTFTARELQFEGNSNRVISGWEDVGKVVDLMKKNPSIRVTIESFIGYNLPGSPEGRGTDALDFIDPSPLIDFYKG